MYYQGLDKLVNQKMSDRLAAEESSLNAAYVSVRTWAAYFANDEGLNVKCLKELLGQCAGIITQLEKAKKDVKKKHLYLLYFLPFNLFNHFNHFIIIIIELMLLFWEKFVYLFTIFGKQKINDSFIYFFTFLLFYFFFF